jgi:DmsE family decaheme c-type cytochrome
MCFGVRCFYHLLLLGSLSVLTFGADTKAPAKENFVGSQPCRTCHPDVTSTFFKNPHHKTTVNESLAPHLQGCESCHGPGKAHVEAKGGKATIFAFSVKKPREIVDRCLTCHAESLNRANIRRSEHTRADVVCTNCHSIHKPASTKSLLAKTQVELCYTCHANVRAQFSMPFKHRVNEGFMTCSDCHNPHGTNVPTWRAGGRPRMVDQSINEEPCLKCHVDKRGPFAFEHVGVRVDGCETCHIPHGSANARLLKRPTAFPLCLECHNGTPGFGTNTATGVPRQSSSHNIADPRYQNCTSCHVRIHGSNVDGRFLR